MQYTEDDYAQLYSELPEGLKDLVLSGRLAILVSAIGSRHGLNADQVADLEPAIEDVCLGLITPDELVENILKSVNIDQRVANRIAAEAELEILKPFGAELLVARKQKEDLDTQIQQRNTAPKAKAQTNPQTGSVPLTAQTVQTTKEPKDVTEHATSNKKVSDWYNKNPTDPVVVTSVETAPSGEKVFDWDKSFGKKEVVKETELNSQSGSATLPTIESKLDVLTENINKLINSRFGNGGKGEDSISEQMQELVKRLERAEKENEENKKIIRSLQTGKVIPPGENLFGSVAKENTGKENKILIDKERKVGIDKSIQDTKNSTNVLPNGNIQITSTSTNSIPIQKPAPNTEPPTKSMVDANKKEEIFSSSVSKDTLDSIVETRLAPTVTTSNAAPVSSLKKVLSLDELLTKGDNKIKEASSQKVGTLVFPGVNDEKRVDIKNVDQQNSLRETLIADLEFLDQKINPENENETLDQETENNPRKETNSESIQTSAQVEVPGNTTGNSQSSTTNLFKDEILPKTKEERMRALQDKIKALNKGVSVGGKTNIAASGLDPYKM
jgi:hypothetical protein